MCRQVRYRGHDGEGYRCGMSTDHERVISTAILPTPDMEAAVAFYGDVGFTVDRSAADYALERSMTNGTPSTVSTPETRPSPRMLPKLNTGVGTYVSISVREVAFDNEESRRNQP